ncbi:iron-containing alcohol dehydrogenase [Psychromonas sp. 14N.309.X.WAT.B.A12]|uniref:iron-containing alcohol dehydrogenase n=1 Tax=Psychromonas sp. 14N.309.X.WAT.B.A12 TaxID=2998322 RepID=UPI0025B15D51|nr:iron-containing alcohol dehydrogenase [Psychromonas sp. 14N.309.X.WAT.B.A12]MDN2664333.1 iron-containing alcohol dehydrogenase [Psychromonas sp. 14N.309.X.WAT.B.A12]
MNNFSYQNTTEIHFGQGQIAAITNSIPKDKKILVTYGGGSIKGNGVYDQVVAALAEHNWDEFSGIEPNPQYDTLMKAVERIRAEGFDYLLAVGGGSVVDGTKFIAAAVDFKGEEAWDILAKQGKIESALPLGCILTLPATGSETNVGAVVTRGKNKLAFQNPLVRPQFAILDPQTTLSLSERQTSNGVVDAFVHVMEQYLTYPVNAKIQDRFAEGILLTLVEEGPKLIVDLQDMEARTNVMWAATQALSGLIGVGVPQDWATHMIGHELTGNFGVDHGRSLTIVLPAIMQVCREEKKAKLLQYAERIWNITEGTDDARIDAAIEKTKAFFSAMNTPVSLSEIDLTQTDVDTAMESLEAHGMTKLGENGTIDLARSRTILETAL